MAIFMDGIGWVDNTPDLDQSDVDREAREMHDREMEERMQGFAIAWDRDEHDPCEAGTPGCSVDHTRCQHDCETW